MNRICFCFGYSEEDITRDVLENKGASTILEGIVNEKKKAGATASQQIRSDGDVLLMSAVSWTKQGIEGSF
jgi:hypothetical protein